VGREDVAGDADPARQAGTVDAQAGHRRRRGKAEGDSDGAAFGGASVRHGLGVRIVAAAEVLEQNPARVRGRRRRRKIFEGLLLIRSGFHLARIRR
jgi:hypothetical protein